MENQETKTDENLSKPMEKQIKLKKFPYSELITLCILLKQQSILELQPRILSTRLFTLKQLLGAVSGKWVTTHSINSFLKESVKCPNEWALGLASLFLVMDT